MPKFTTNEDKVWAWLEMELEILDEDMAIDLLDKADQDFVDLLQQMVNERKTK